MKGRCPRPLDERDACRNYLNYCTSLTSVKYEFARVVVQFEHVSFALPARVVTLIHTAALARWSGMVTAFNGFKRLVAM